MVKREVNPFVKSALEIGPVLAFFGAYFLLKDQTFIIRGMEYDGFILATAGFVPLMVFTTGLLTVLSGRVSPMQVLTLVLIIVFGGLSVWLNDERFFKMKPTIIYLVFAGILGIGLIRGQSYLRTVMEEMMPLQPEGWMILTRRLSLFFLALAVLNEVIWRTQATETWVWFKTFGLSLAVFGFFMAQGGLFKRYGDAKDD
jgi:intracellular septation protein